MTKKLYKEKLEKIAERLLRKRIEFLKAVPFLKSWSEFSL